MTFLLCRGPPHTTDPVFCPDLINIFACCAHSFHNLEPTANSTASHFGYLTSLSPLELSTCHLPLHHGSRQCASFTRLEAIKNGNASPMRGQISRRVTARGSWMRCDGLSWSALRCASINPLNVLVVSLGSTGWVRCPLEDWRLVV